MTIINKDNNKLKSLKANDFFELHFTNYSQYLSFYASSNLKLFIVNNNSNIKKYNSNTENISRFTLKPSSNIKKSFTQKSMYDFFKVSNFNLTEY